MPLASVPLDLGSDVVYIIREAVNYACITRSCAVQESLGLSLLLQ